MGRLFDRVWSVTVSTLDVSDFRVHFRIEKTLKPEPNKALVEVYGLNKDHRAMLGELAPGKRTGKKKKGTSPNLTGSIPVRIEAGYKDDGPQMIFLGDLRTVDSERNGADWITAITSGDGERAYRTARIAQSFGAGTPVPVAVRALVRSLGIGEGNLSQVLSGLKLGGRATILVRGAVFSGPAVRHLTDICRSAQLEWSIQDGVVQLQDFGTALAGQAIKLTPETGLIGSPNVDGNGVLKAKTLMIPGLRCGRLVVVDSDAVQGNFRVEKIITEGDTHGQDWGHEIEAKRY
jgi:hypothetical protein